ncbi:MAG: dipeptidyl peptidase 3 [Bacteroidetes bacterium]|nr:dipeptidyl peptidase 3 [Bacteroidota bacterium]
MKSEKENFKYQSEKFADIEILRYQVPGFEELTLKEKKLAYYLYEAALSGRDILYDQHYKHNLKIRKTLEAIVKSYSGDRDSDEFKKFIIYTKRVWFSNGIHHHYSTKKILPEISTEYFRQLISNSDQKLFPVEENETINQFIEKLTPLIFFPNIDSQRVNLNPNTDVIKSSAGNFYEGLSQKEVEEYYKKVVDKNNPTPISYGLNSKLVKENGKIIEKRWKAEGMYSPAIERIIYWLEKAVSVAENEIQKSTLLKLAEFYKTGDLKLFDEYNILWLQDTDSRVDTVNGFIEVYSDPLGYRGSFEGIVSIKDLEATKRMKAISDQAQWFENNSPIDEKFKKKNVIGVTAKAITVVVESGDSSPSTPIGINLPNATWIREKYGSKSVNLGNIVLAYDLSEPEELKKEFSYSDYEIDLANKYEAIADTLHTDLHEVIGHGSGKIMPGVGAPKQTLKNYASTIEETRADLVALYYLLDEKLIEIGIMPSIEAAKAEYNKYIRKGLMIQLARIEIGDNLEESHMRNRQLISKWAYEHGKDEKIIERKIKNGKTYFVINDYQKLRKLFGELLKEVQRITSTGDFEAAKNLVEAYGVKIELELHKEVKERYDKLGIPPYKGFINPVLNPVYENEKIIDVKIKYPDDFTEQMMFYAEKYSFLLSSS